MPAKKAAKKTSKSATKKKASKPAAKKKATKKPAAKKTVSKKKAIAKKPAPKKTVKKPAAKKKIVKKPAPKKVAPKKAPVKKAAPKPPVKKAAPKPVKAALVAPPKPVAKPTPPPEPIEPPKPTRPKKLPPAFASSTMDKFRAQLQEERVRHLRQAEELLAEADELVKEGEQGDTQFDEESGEGDTISVERERGLQLSAEAMHVVEEIDHALERFEDGSFGYCQNCWNKIPVARLEALPYTELCVECKAKGERRY